MTAEKIPPCETTPADDVDWAEKLTQSAGDSFAVRDFLEDVNRGTAGVDGGGYSASSIFA